MTTANKLTILRILLIPVFIILMYSSFKFHVIIALAIFIGASLTDLLDGHIARKYHQVTDFGKFADPLADKLLVTAALTALLGAFLGTRLGLSIRATGDNRDMVRASSVNPTFTITVGLCISNAMTALSGAMVGQYQSAADINGGTGIVVIGLACLIIGETVIGRRSVLRGAL